MKTIREDDYSIPQKFKLREQGHCFSKLLRMYTPTCYKLNAPATEATTTTKYILSFRYLVHLHNDKAFA